MCINPTNTAERIGTEQYRAYMATLRLKEPQVFPDSLSQLPHAPTDLARLKTHPEEAANTHIRDQCERCHWAVKGRQRRAETSTAWAARRVIFLAARTVITRAATLPLRRINPGTCSFMRSKRRAGAKVTVHGKTYTGVPIATCMVCHNRGKRFGQLGENNSPRQLNLVKRTRLCVQ